MSALDPGVLVEGASVDIPLAPLPVEDVVDGTPAAGSLTLHEGDVEIGVWEMTPGTATDTEIDEVFVVLAGHATVRFDEPALPSIEIGPGSIVRLTAGMRTTWVVRETLRKVYVA